ncbi:MAG: 2-hydroxyacyl-CoA dehydratase, partial [Desulfomonilaceae bacterium]
FHSNRSCKWISQDVIALREAITERTGIPGVIFEADQNDPRLYSFENLEKQIDSFLELLSVKTKKV